MLVILHCTALHKSIIHSFHTNTMAMAMDPGCLMCNNLHLYRHRCPVCYLLLTSHHVYESLIQWFSKTLVLGGSGPRTIMVLEDPHPHLPKVHGKPKMARKTVSINHNVEYIEDYVSTKKRKRKTMEQWPSMEIEGDDIKPLKSILKLPSNPTN